MTIEDLYDKKFFDEHIIWKEDYFRIADWIFDNLHPTSVVDLGCGAGYLDIRIKERLSDIAITAIDGSSDVLRSVYRYPDIQIQDLTVPIDAVPRDLVIATEVIEHLPYEGSLVYLDNIARCTSNVLVFSAAVPGQRGTGHINLRPASHWLEILHKAGIVCDSKTDSLRSLCRTLKGTWWFKDTIWVMRRVS